ncbi:MAG: hypothetical protein C4527_21025 [Candidatus Omnitrophota bacterium]|jgi:hypothetical protein|nr:MAG: hypothetical protein C4527_21025 [Candidatus Omnitrophota bacterium]
MSERYERAKEEITDVLVEEYLKQNPGVDKHQVMMACKDGRLILTDMAAVLAEMKIRKNFRESLDNAGKMFASITIHENQRWKECITSTEQSKLIIDCLHSSPFYHYDKEGWNREHAFIKKQERICARATVKLEEYKEKLAELKKQGKSVQTPVGRTYVIEYLKWVIDQLQVLHHVYEKEIELGDTFETCASKHVNVLFEKVKRDKASFNIDELNRIYKALLGDKKGSLDLGNSAELNIDLLVKAKNSLTQAVDGLKTKIETRRVQFQEIWSTITSMQEVVKNMEEMNKLDKAGKLPPEINDEKEESTTKAQRMARFVNVVKKKF